MSVMYRNYDRMSDRKKRDLHASAERFLAGLDGKTVEAAPPQPARLPGI